MTDPTPCLATVEPSDLDEATAASAADVPTLLAHIAATRERHAAEVAAARAEALREAEDAARDVAAERDASPSRWTEASRAFIGGALRAAEAVAALGAKGGV